MELAVGWTTDPLPISLRNDGMVGTVPDKVPEATARDKNGGEHDCLLEILRYMHGPQSLTCSRALEYYYNAETLVSLGSPGASECESE